MAGLALAAWVVMPSGAHAQLESREAIQLQNQLLELRRDVQSLREQVSRQGSSSGSSGGSILSFGRPSGATSGGGEMTAALLDRVAALEDQVRRLQGKLDEVDNARQRQGEDLKKDLEDLNFKLGAGAGAAGAAAARPNAPPRAVGPPLRV